MENQTKTKKILLIIVTLLVIVGLGLLSYNFKSSIKSFFGFATVYDAFGQRAVDQGWVISSSSYAWSENSGWIDFSPTGGSTYVADNGLWGYAWGENIGWISLNCENTETCLTVDYKIANNGEGLLSGYAWSENTGWIDFGTSTDIASRDWGVSIDASGDFQGNAWGENIGWISFNSGAEEVVYKVSTNWRPQSSRPQCNNGLDDDSDTLLDYPDDTNCLSLTDDNEDIHAPLNFAASAITNCGSKTINLSWDASTGADGYQVFRDDVQIATSTDASYASANPAYNASYTFYVKAYDSDSVSAASDSATDATAVACHSRVEELTQEKVPATTTPATTTSTTTPATTGSHTGTTTTNTNAGNTGTSSSKKELIPINTIILPVIIPQVLKMTDLPMFTEDTSDKTNTFTFVPQLSSFLFASLPDSILNMLNKSPKLKEYLAQEGFSKAQNLVILSRSSLLLKQPEKPVPGLFSISNGTTTVKIYLTNDPQYGLVQNVRVASGTQLTISMVSITKEEATGEWNSGEQASFTENDPYVTTEFIPGALKKHVLTTNSSPMPLMIEVISSSPSVTSQITSSSNLIPWVSRVLKWFKR